jgi:cyclopropane fatty-acyl-phospholipid synthase-like methyltransferase
MPTDTRLMPERFPRSARYHPEWMIAGLSSAANALWLTEALDLKPGMRVLDLGCGRGMSSVFLRREFGVQAWATDLWFSASERFQRIRDSGVEDGVFPIYSDARTLPFATEFFDAIVSIDSYFYFGTDDHYLNYLARFVKPGGPIGIAGVGVLHEIEGPVPAHLRDWWTPDAWCLHSAAWWRRHWEKTGILDHCAGRFATRRLAILARLDQIDRARERRGDSCGRSRRREKPRLRSRHRPPPHRRAALRAGHVRADGIREEATASRRVNGSAGVSPARREL